MTPKFKKEIEYGLKSSWSPEQICGRYQLEQKQNKDCLVTLLERKTRFYLAFMILDRTAKSMFSAIEQLYKLFPKEALKTFISDRGKEFNCYPLVETNRRPQMAY